jgi:hypothetical protein
VLNESPSFVGLLARIALDGDVWTLLSEMEDQVVKGLFGALLKVDDMCNLGRWCADLGATDVDARNDVKLYFFGICNVFIYESLFYFFILFNFYAPLINYLETKSALVFKMVTSRKDMPPQVIILVFLRLVIRKTTFMVDFKIRQQTLDYLRLNMLEGKRSILAVWAHLTI